MKKFLLVFLLMLLAFPAYAAEPACPGPDVDLGGAVKLRGYSMDNFWDFNRTNHTDNWEMFRLYSSVFGSVDLGDNVLGYIQLSNQTYGEGDYTNIRYEAQDNSSNKVFVDNAYIDINKIFESPLSFRMGRQNLMYGSGFVIFDGQSQFASTSLYFDGVKMTLDITDKAKIDFLYMKDQEYNTANSPRDDITLSGAYFTGKCPVLGGTQEIYVLNRLDEEFTFPATTGIRGDKDIWMYGLRLSDKFAVGLDYSAEIAYQDGELNDDADIDQEALGYKLDTGWTFDTPVKPRIFAGYAFMSGDNNFSDGESNAWDVFYGGWPQFGDLLAWTFVNTGPNVSAADAVTGFKNISSQPGEAAFTNLMLPKVGVSAVAGNVFAELSYTKILIDEPVNVSSHDFGDYYQLTAKYPYNKYLTFGVYAAMIDPGNAFDGPIYDANNAVIAVEDDHSYEAYWETQIKF